MTFTCQLKPSIAGACLAVIVLTSPVAYADALLFNGFAVGSAAVTLVSPVSEGTSAGEFSFTNVMTNEELFTFCIDVNKFIQWGPTTYTRSSLADDPIFNPMQKTRIDELFTSAFGLIGSDGNKAAAFQLALWELVYDTPVSGPTTFSTGNFRATSSAVGGAAALLDGLGSATGGWALTTWRSGTGQDQISVTQVSEPGTFPMLFAALGALGFMMRRKSNA
jgi:hypothetical protein